MIKPANRRERLTNNALIAANGKTYPIAESLAGWGESGTGQESVSVGAGTP